MKFKIKQSILALALTASVIAPAAIAADKSIEKAIKARQGLMQVYSFNLGLLSAMAKGEMDYDAELAANAAANLNAAVTMKNGAMWPQGSGNDSEYKTRALAEIWSTYPEIADKGKAMAEASGALMAVAGNGLDALKGSIGDAGKSCKGCHDDFRAKKK